MSRVDSGGIWPGDESYFQNIRETALQDTIEQLTKELAEARAEIERKDKLIEQMREALQDAIDWLEDDRFDDDYICEQWYHDGKAALEAAEGGE